LVNISESLRQQITTLLGREPRGLEAVAVSGPQSQPMVIRVASLVEDKPFPTLFWLIDKDLCYRIDQLEAAGLIKQFQQRIDTDPPLQASMREDHARYIRLREEYMSDAIRERLAVLGYASVFTRKGIGGIGDETRIRCLHTWYGAHLVVPNTIGRMLDDWWAQSPPIDS
jgi:hypothetical protein